MGHTLATGTYQFPQTYKHLALSLPAESSRSISIGMLITPQLLASNSEYPTQWCKMNRFQQCLLKCTSCLDETSCSNSVGCDVNTHTGIERCVMYSASFRTFPSSTRGRPFEASVVFQANHIVNNNWTIEIWNEKFSYRIFTYIQNEISIFNVSL